jgi:predicted aspartyl protease
MRAAVLVATLAALAVPALAAPAGDEPDSAQVTGSAVTPPPSATPCPLQQVASLDIVTEPDGSFAVPMTIEDKPGLMLVDTGSIYSVISESEARARDMSIRVGLPVMHYLGGVPIYKSAKADTIQLGAMTGHDLTMMVVPGAAELQHNVIGMVGPDILQNYDVELDFAAGKMNLFDVKHCPGQVVYWTHTPYAAVPIRMDNGGHMFVDVQVNGKTISAGVDTGADRSTMPLRVAKELFGIDAHSPGMKPLGDIRVNGTQPAPLYRYPFDTLTLEGVTVHQPVIDILDGDRFEVGGGNQMLLGIKTLRQLHIYISYNEKMLYLTPAEAR